MVNSKYKEMIPTVSHQPELKTHQLTAWKRQLVHVETATTERMQWLYGEVHQCAHHVGFAAVMQHAQVFAS